MKMWELQMFDVTKLVAGDEVYWSDPDGGKCSRHIRINHIKINGDVVSIEDVNGDCVECFASELS